MPSSQKMQPAPPPEFAATPPHLSVALARRVLQRCGNVAFWRFVADTSELTATANLLTCIAYRETLRRGGKFQGWKTTFFPSAVSRWNPASQHFIWGDQLWDFY